MRARLGFVVAGVAVAVAAALVATKVIDVRPWFGGGTPAPDVDAPDAAGAPDAKNPSLAKGAGDKNGAKGREAAEAEVPAEPRLPSEAKGSAPERGGASVRGRVVEEHGRAPVEGARVRLLRPDSLFIYLHAKQVGHHDDLVVETDAQGRFAFRDVLPLSGYALLVRRSAAPGAAAVAAATLAKVDLSPREAFDAGDVVVGPAGGLGGRVTGPDGAPVAGARVAVSWEVKNEVQVILSEPDTLPWIEAEARTDADGKWACPALEPGDKTVLVKSPSGATEVKSPITCTAGEQRRDVDFALVGSLWFAGRVVRTDAAPLAGARVFAAASSRAAGWTVESAADGSFRIGPLVEGTYRIGALLAGMPVRLAFQKKAPDESLKFEFPFPGAITGRVTSSISRKPVRDFRVLARYEGEQSGMAQYVSNLIQKTVGATAVSSADGTFRLDGLQPGPHRVVVEAEGYPKWESPEPVTVVEGRDVESPPIELPDGNPISGVVVDAAGAPIAKVRVYVADDGDEDEATPEQVPGLVEEMELNAEATTDEAGLFKTKPLTPRKYRLVFTAPGRLSVVKAGVDVTGTPLEGMRVVLKSAAKIRVRTVSSTGVPAPLTTVALWHESATGLSAPTGQDGVLELDARPGRWVVVCSGRGSHAAEFRVGQDLQKGANAETRFERYRAIAGAQEVVAVEGSTHEATVRLPRLVTVHGRLRDIAPAGDDAYLSLVGPDGWGPWIHAPLDASGRFTAEHVEPGPARVYLTVKGEKGVLEWVSFGPYEVRDQDPSDLEVSGKPDR